MKLRIFFLAVMLCLSSALFGQTQLGTLTCSDVGGGSVLSTPSGGIYAHDQCRFSLRPDGHGTMRLTGEIGVNTTGNTYAISLLFPAKLPQIMINEINLNVDLVSWCVGSSGMLLTIDGINGSNLETLAATKATLNVPTGSPGWTIASRQFVIHKNLVNPIPVTSIGFYHFTDGCSVVTYNYTLELSF